MKRIALISLLAAACGGAPRPAVPATPIPTVPVAPPAAPTPSDAPWEASKVDWSKPPAGGAEPAFTPPTPRRVRLANGADLLIIENRRLPLVSVRAIFHRAGSREDGAASGLAAITADLLDEGAGKLDAQTLPEELERLGARLEIRVASDAATIYLDTLSETLEPSLALLADIIVRPTLSDADWKRIQGDRLAELALRPDRPREVAGLVFDQQIFGNHPYGSPGSGFVGTVQKLRLADAKKLWKSRYVPAATTFIVAGDVDGAAIEGVFTEAFRDWSGKAPPATRPPKPAAGKPHGITFIHRPDASQSVVVIGRLGDGAPALDRAAPEVINAAVGGSFLSRLNGRLREELGYTYGISSRYWRGQWGGNWSITSSLKTANTIDGIREVLRIIGETQKTPLPDAEHQKTVQMLTRGIPLNFETNAAIAQTFATLDHQKLPLDWYATWADKLRGTTAAQLQAAAATWSDLSIVIVGDRAAVGAGLSELGLPITYVDAEGKRIETP